MAHPTLLMLVMIIWAKSVISSVLDELVIGKFHVILTKVKSFRHTWQIWRNLLSKKMLKYCLNQPLKKDSGRNSRFVLISFNEANQRSVLYKCYTSSPSHRPGIRNKHSPKSKWWILVWVPATRRLILCTGYWRTGYFCWNSCL